MTGPRAVPLDLTAIEARLKAATPGPWEWDVTYDDDHIIRMATAIERPANHECQDSIIYDHGLHPENGVQYERAQANAEFIAHAPEDVAALLEALHETRAALVRMSAPYVAVTMDAESRKWIAPSIWNDMIAAYKEAVRVLESVGGGAVSGGPDR